MRMSTFRTAAVAASVGIGFAAVGSARADDHSSSVCVDTTAVAAAAEPAAAPTTAAAAPTTAAAAPTTAAAAPTTAAAAPTTTAAAPTTATGAPASALPAAATVQQFQAVMASVVGPTTDLPGALVPLGITPPVGIPTPEGSVVESFDLYYYPDAEDPADSYYDAQLVFTSSMPAADMVTLFQTQMVAGGYIQTGDSVENDDNRQIRFLDYDTPNSTYERATVTIGIVDGDTDFAQLEFTDALDPTVIEAFSAWPTGMPMIDQATSIDDASLHLNNFGSDYAGRIDTSWTLPIPAADAHAQLLAALPSSPYTVDPDYEASETSVYLLGGEFESVTVNVGEGFPEDTSYFSVAANFDIQL